MTKVLSRRTVFSHAAAVGSVVLLFLLRGWLMRAGDIALAPTVVAFFLPMVACATILGKREAVTALVVGTILADPQLLHWPMTADAPVRLLRLTMFVIVGLTFLYFIWRRYAAEERFQERLHSQVESLAAIVEGSHDAIVAQDDQGQITYWGKGAAKLLGYPEAEMLGHTLRRVQTAEGYAAGETARQKVLAGEPVSGYRSVWVGRENQRVCMDMVLTLARDGAGRIQGTSGAGRDVTLEESMYRRSRESEELVRGTLDALHSHVAIVDARGTILAVNRAWREFAVANGAAAERVGPGANYLAACPPSEGEWDESGQQGEDFAAGFQAVATGGRESFEFEYRCDSPEERRWFIVWVTRFAVGSSVRLVVKHENITERKRAEQAERQKLALQDSVAGMEGVLGVVGHELRTPLAGIRGMAEMLLTAEVADAKQHGEFIQAIHDEAIRMAATVNDLLEVTRMNSGIAKWNWARFRVADACAQAADTVRPLLRDTAIQLTVEHENPELMMHGDAEAVRRLVMNLLSNAVRHTQRGHIRVTTAAREDETGQWAIIRVEDTGTGMPARVLAKLGRAFELNAGMVGEGHTKGAGLGVTICAGIAAAHGGQLETQSVEGAGTLVTVALRRDLSRPYVERGKVDMRNMFVVRGAAEACERPERG
jgi:PAS domain S-box-containing protein